jgi:NAD+ synthase (glutamine-hydrolysing)
VLAAHALGSENVKVLMMQSSFSSEHSITDSEILVQQLGVQSEIVPIKAIYDSFLHTLAPSFQNLPFNVAEENLQARIRGVLLMAQSNKFGSILLNTSNKSEAAVGYGTLYGDMCGGLSVIGDLYKTEVYQLCNYINLKYGLIPKNIITKPPSAELRPGQKDSDSLPDYAILDQILRLYIEDRCSRETIIEKGFEPTLVQRVLKLVNSNEYKRYQTPPMLRLSSKAFGLGRRMPIVGKYLYQ